MTKSTPYYKGRYGRTFTPGEGLPTVSTELDSVRAYQFEIHFIGLPGNITNEQDLTLAAKKVGGLELKNEAIVVDRVNDKLHYPGKTTMGELTVDFDNLYLRETAADLFRFFQSIYDPITGEMTQFQPGGGGAFKVDKVEVVMLDNTMEPISTVELYGVYPTSWQAAEFNYSTNQFHQLTVNFKYDFIRSYNYSNPKAGNTAV